MRIYYTCSKSRPAWKMSKTTLTLLEIVYVDFLSFKYHAQIWCFPLYTILSMFCYYYMYWLREIGDVSSSFFIDWMEHRKLEIKTFWQVCSSECILYVSSAILCSWNENVYTNILYIVGSPWVGFPIACLLAIFGNLHVLW